MVAEAATVIGVARNPNDVTDGVESMALDITDKSAVCQLIGMLKPDAIIHAAACNPGARHEQMDAVNNLGTSHVACAAARTGARLVAVSTDIVHDGSQAPYADDAVPSPSNPYGTSKALGEQAVMEQCPDAIVARTSLIYGLKQIDRGTAGFVDRVRSGQILSLYTDVIRQPIWVESLARALRTLALEQTRVTGLLNLVGSQAMSRADFGLAMLKHWGVSVPAAQLQRVRAGQRPGIALDCRMRIDRARALGLALPGVDEVLNKAASDKYSVDPSQVNKNDFH